MLTHLLIWQYWQSQIRAERACHPIFYDGHTPAEEAAFVRRMGHQPVPA